MATTFWDQRFSTPEFVYGLKPNPYFEHHLSQLEPGHLLLPAEGEGRHALHALENGWEVSAFDDSHIARTKAMSMIHEAGHEVNYLLDDVENVILPEDYFDMVAQIYLHVSPADRRRYHHKLLRSLVPGGYYLFVGFSKKQLGLTSGGPRDLTMLLNRQELEADFAGLSTFEIHEHHVELDEGPYHQGEAHLITLFGQK